ncbi:MAG: hypothetical protein J1G04_02605 [Clostridiales bacterium]|nr:hypothetical protein [Clostridiales bacterium]
MAVKAGCGGSFDGLCCRMVIETVRVFDGCMTVDENTTLNLATTESIPQGAEFATARVVDSRFENVTISDDEDGRSIVRGDIVTDFEVTYTIDNAAYVVAASFRASREVLLRLPVGGLVPYQIKVQSVFRLAGGTIVGENAVAITGCFIQIIKVTAPVDILIPTYGYCNYPPCEFCQCGCNNANGSPRVFPFLPEE